MNVSVRTIEVRNVQHYWHSLTHDFCMLQQRHNFSETTRKCEFSLRRRTHTWLVSKSGYYAFYFVTLMRSYLYNAQVRDAMLTLTS